MTRWLGTALGLVCASGIAGAATVQYWSIAELTAHSERIVVAEVATVEATLDAGRVMTTTRFVVKRQLKGSKDGAITLTQLGGVVGVGTKRVHTSVPGYATFVRGERVLLFLERTDTGRLVVAGLSQGKYTLTHDAKTGEVMATRYTGDLHFLRSRNPHIYALAGVAPDENRLPLRHLVATIQGRTVSDAPRVMRTRQVSIGTEGVAR